MGLHFPQVLLVTSETSGTVLQWVAVVPGEDQCSPLVGDLRILVWTDIL